MAGRCDFCDRLFYDAINNIKSEELVDIYPKRIHNKIVMRIRDGENVINFKIKFCPICGKKLE